MQNLQQLSSSVFPNNLINQQNQPTMQNELKADLMSDISQLIGRKYESFSLIESHIILFFGGCDHVSLTHFRDEKTTHYHLNGKTVEIKTKRFNDRNKQGLQIESACFV